MARQEELVERYEDALFTLLMNGVAEAEGKRLQEESAELKKDPSAAVPERVNRRCIRTINRAFAREKRIAFQRTSRRVLQRAAIVAVCEHEYSYALRDRYGSNPFDPFDTMEDIALAKEQADYVIVMYHGGKEQCEYPSPRLRKACRAMVRAGADIVLCQHSHCVGCREEYRGGEIVYGQGNFNFVKYIDHPHWHNGLMMDVQLEGDLKVEYIPVVAADEGIELAKGAEREAILSGFAERSALLQDEEQWLAAWKAFCESMPNYIAAVRDAYTDVPEGEMCRQIFPHYLDCEAHLDVWQTIYKTWHADKTSGA